MKLSDRIKRVRADYVHNRMVPTVETMTGLQTEAEALENKIDALRDALERIAIVDSGADAIFIAERALANLVSGK